MRFAALLLSISFAVLLESGSSSVAAAKTEPAKPAVALDALLLASRLASGAPYRYHIVSHSHESRGGRTYDVTTETDGSKYRATSCSRGLCTGYYFDGERAFGANYNDTALPLSARRDALQITLRAIVSYAFTAPDFRTNGGELSEREPVLREGRSYRRLAVAPFRGSPLDAIVDPSSGLVVGIVSDERKYTFQLRDQRKVDGKITLPFEISLNGTVVERFERRTIETAPLEGPVGLLPTFTGAPASIAMSKLDRTPRQPVVPCTIGSEHVNCLLDTGNSGLSMSLELAEGLGIEPRGGAFNIRGVGSYVTGVVRAPTLTVGNATYPGAYYVVLHDLRPYGYDVVLGADVFARTRITIDYSKRSVTIAPSPATGLVAPRNAVALSFDGFIPIASVRIGEQSAPLAIDTGDESTINLAYEYYAAHPGIFSPIGTTPVSGIGGTSSEIFGEISRVRFGDYDVIHPKIGATKSLAAIGEGHLGSGFLEHFVVTFDYSRSRLELVAQPGDASVRAIQ